MEVAISAHVLVSAFISISRHIDRTIKQAKQHITFDQKTSKTKTRARITINQNHQGLDAFRTKINQESHQNDPCGVDPKQDLREYDVGIATGTRNIVTQRL